jgi:hypothetical protein
VWPFDTCPAVPGHPYTENQLFFRAVNEKVFELSTPAGERISVLCECGVIACAERIDLALDEYLAVRSLSNHFLLAPGHEHPAEGDRVVDVHDRWVVVEHDPPE